MPETKETKKTSQQKMPERGTAEAAKKNAATSSSPKEGASSRGRESISKQNKTSSEE